MKLTTKLLLGATLVAGLSVSAFAACASDVDFGSTDGTNGKKITGLMNGSNSQDAVNVGQTLTETTVNLIDTNASRVTSWDQGGWKVRATKVGRMVCLSGLFKNVSGADLDSSSGSLLVATVPSGYEPKYAHRVTTRDHVGNDEQAHAIDISTTNNVHWISTEAGIWESGSHLSVHTCYIGASL